jgi:hypothetical protein
MKNYHNELNLVVKKYIPLLNLLKIFRENIWAKLANFEKNWDSSLKKQHT